jgi:hypothetical protein
MALVAHKASDLAFSLDEKVVIGAIAHNATPAHFAARMITSTVPSGRLIQRRGKIKLVWFCTAGRSSLAFPRRHNRVENSLKPIGQSPFFRPVTVSGVVSQAIIRNLKCLLRNI